MSRTKKSATLRPDAFLNKEELEQLVEAAKTGKAKELAREQAAKEQQPIETALKPKAAQEQPKTAQEQPKTAQEQPKTAQEQPKTAQEQPKTAQEQPKAAQEQPKTAQEQPKAAQEQPKAAPKPKVKKPQKEKPKGQPKVETVDNFGLPAAKAFPAIIKEDTFGTLKKFEGATYENVKQAINEGKIIVFATYWTPKHIKQFQYKEMFYLDKAPKKFPFDLDLLQAVYVCSKIDRIYALSIYTDAMFNIFPDDFTPVELETPEGEKYLMKYSAGMEFEVYVAEE